MKQALNHYLVTFCWKTKSPFSETPSRSFSVRVNAKDNNLAVRKARAELLKKESDILNSTEVLDLNFLVTQIEPRKFKIDIIPQPF